MNWGDERYVRLYTRNTTDWVLLPWQSRALFPLILRACDRTGVLPLGKHGAAGLAALVLLPVEVVAPGLEGLTLDGCVRVTKRDDSSRDEHLVVVNFLEAQEATSSIAFRAREYRERKRSESLSVTKRDDGVTKRDDSSRAVTRRHAPSRTVTPSVPCCTVPTPLPPEMGGQQGSDLAPDLAAAETSAPADIERDIRRSMQQVWLEATKRPLSGNTETQRDAARQLREAAAVAGAAPAQYMGRVFVAFAELVTWLGDEKKAGRYQPKPPALVLEVLVGGGNYGRAYLPDVLDWLDGKKPQLAAVTATRRDPDEPRRAAAPGADETDRMLAERRRRREEAAQ